MFASPPEHTAPDSPSQISGSQEILAQPGQQVRDYASVPAEIQMVCPVHTYK